MKFNNTLLSPADQAALTAAIAAIPPLLTPLGAQITSAQAASASVVSIKGQIDTARANFTGGAVSMDFNALAVNLNTAEANCLGATEALHTACQACQPLVEGQLLPIALRQAQKTVKNANATLMPSGINEADAGPLATPLPMGVNAFFRSCFGPRETGILVVLAKATKLQSLLQNIQSGTDFFTLP